MSRTQRWLAVGLVLVMATAFGGAATAKPGNGRGASVVFVQSNDPTGNEIVAYRANGDGTLTETGSFPTGGLGGIAEGAESDPLASQNSLVYDASRGLLFAVNAGSDSLSVFKVKGDRLRLREEIGSGGLFPVSITIHGALVYVLNAGGDGNVSGFRVHGKSGRLEAIDGSTRSLGLGNTNPPNFLLSPAQIGFTPDGSQLVVTTKGNGTIEVFGVQDDGTPTAESVSTPDPGGPFAFLFDGAGRMLLTEAGAQPGQGALTSYAVNPDGTVTVVDGPVPNGQTATCWIVSAMGHLFVSNTGSNTISSYTADAAAQLELVDATAASTDTGPIDMAVSRDGSILYLQNGVDQTIQSFRVGADGSLELLATTPGPPQVNGVPFEGIVAV